MQRSSDNWHRVTSRFDYSIMQMQSKTTVICRIIVILRNITDVDKKIWDRMDDGTPAGRFLVSLRSSPWHRRFSRREYCACVAARTRATVCMCACIISTETGWLSNVLYRRGKSRSIRQFSARGWIMQIAENRSSRHTRYYRALSLGFQSILK